MITRVIYSMDSIFFHTQARVDSSNILITISCFFLHLSFCSQGRIRGGRTALWARACLQERLACLGGVLHNHAGKVLFVAILVLASFCVGLKSVQMHTRVDQLWIQGSNALCYTFFPILTLKRHECTALYAYNSIVARQV